MTDEVHIPVPLHLMGYKEWAVVAAHFCAQNGGSFTIRPEDTAVLETGPYSHHQLSAYIDGDKVVHFRLDPIEVQP